MEMTILNIPYAVRKGRRAPVPRAEYTHDRVGDAYMRPRGTIRVIRGIRAMNELCGRTGQS